MANERSAQQKVEKALSAKAEELGMKPTENTVYFWLKEIGVHKNPQNYAITRAWREDFQGKKPVARDDVPESDIVALREAQHDAAASIEQSYRRIYSAAVEKIRSEAQMRVDAAMVRVAENDGEQNFLLASWRATEDDLSRSRQRVESLEKELEDARLELAGLRGRLAASNDLIGKLTGSFTRVAGVDNAAADIRPEASADIEAIDHAFEATAEQHPTDAIAFAPVKAETAELARQLMHGPAGDDDTDSDHVVNVEANRTALVSSAMMIDADAEKGQAPAIATPPSSSEQVVRPIVDDTNAKKPAHGDDD